MKTLKKLTHLLEDIEDDGIDQDDIAIDPKAIHVISDEQINVTESQDEE